MTQTKIMVSEFFKV